MTGEKASEVLRRWQQFGGVWRVVSVDQDCVTLSLCRCDAGEEVERLTSSDPELKAFIDGRISSDQELN